MTTTRIRLILGAITLSAIVPYASAAPTQDQCRQLHEQLHQMRESQLAAYPGAETARHNARINALQTSTQCLATAKSREQIRGCEQQEHTALGTLKDTNQAARKSHRAQAESLMEQMRQCKEAFGGGGPRGEMPPPEGKPPAMGEGDAGAQGMSDRRELFRQRMQGQGGAGPRGGMQRQGRFSRGAPEPAAPE